MTKLDREPDFILKCFDLGGNLEKTFRYWVDENTREITYHQEVGVPNTIDTNIDVKYIYENTKAMVDSLGDRVDPDYKNFVDAYEEYIMEKELLG